MILRRIIAHFRKQEWTAIGLDFFIVVVGVFVGMQVSNWNADAADRRRGTHYIERLSQDMARDLEMRRGEAAYYGAVLASVQRTNELLADAGSDPEALVVNAYRASEITYWPQTRATWDEIVSSGDVGLLPQEAVDSGISAYYASDASRFVYDIMQESDYRTHVRQLIPMEVQAALRAGCSDVRNEAQQITGFVEQCELEVDRGLLIRTANTLRADSQLRAELQYQYSDAYTAQANISGDVVYLEQSLAALAGRD
jgi:hypothetical protein